MTFNEKVIKLVKERTNALSGKKGLNESEGNAEEERDFNYRYLFGYSGDEGVNDLISSYAEEMYEGTGRDFSSPILRLNTDNDWRNRLVLSVTIPGDGDIYIDTDANGVADKTINPASEWLNNNSDNGLNTGGLCATCIDVQDTIGETASDNANGRGDFDTKAEAETQRDLDKGSGIRGLRTENSEVYYFDPYWHIGQLGIDTPDNFDNPEHDTFLTDLNNVITGITAYIAQMESVLPIIDHIDNDNNQLFVDMDAKSDAHFVANILGDPTDIAALKSTLEGYRTQAQNLYNYFNQFTADDDISGEVGYNRTTFDNNIDTTYTLMTNIRNSLVTRSNSALSKLGTISSGLKKYRYFWVSENVKKPVSPLIVLQGVGNAQGDTQQAIDNANNALDLLFGDPDKYVETPNLLSVSYNPIIDPVTLAIAIDRIHLIWTMIPFANKYKIYRQDITTGLTPSNNNWSETYFLNWHIELDPDTNSISGIFYDTNYTLGRTYLYRVQALDSNEGPTSPLPRLDSFNSKSLQSNTYDHLNEISFVDIVNGLITVSAEHEIKKNNFIAILDVGYYKVSYVDLDNNIQLINTSISMGSGTLAKASGVVEA